MGASLARDPASGHMIESDQERQSCQSCLDTHALHSPPHTHTPIHANVYTTPIVCKKNTIRCGSLQTDTHKSMLENVMNSVATHQGGIYHLLSLLILSLFSDGQQYDFIMFSGNY